MYQHFSLWLLLSLLVSLNTAQAALQAQLDRTEINEFESVTLSVSSPERNASSPDFSVLEQDFTVGSTSQSTSIQFINGKQTMETRWSVALEPKRTGTLKIPPLQVGREYTQPLTLKVSKGEVAKPSEDEWPDVFIEFTAEPNTAYVNSQILLRVRLNYAVNLRGGSLSEPESDKAQIQKLGEDKQFSARHNHRHYTVVERSYALFPEEAGALELPAIRFEGQIPDNSRRRSAFPSFFDDNLRTIRQRSQALKLEIQPQPAAFPPQDQPQAWWLPAQEVKLQETWTPEPVTFRVGDPVTRKITLQALGLSADHLPPWADTKLQDFNTYADQPTLESQAHSKGVLGQRIDSIAFIPQKAGSYTLPALRLPWWDVKADRLRYAEIPAKTIEVLPSLNAAPQVQANPTPAPQTTLAPNLDSTPDTPAAPPQVVYVQEAGIWQWVSAGFAVLWLLTLLLWGRSLRMQRQQAKETETPPKAPSISASEARKAIKQACLAQDAKKARQALITWAQQAGNAPHVQQLAQLQHHFKGHSAAQDALRYLDQHLYAPSKTDWDAAAAWNILEPALKVAEKQIDKVQNPTQIQLYPNAQPS